MAGEQRVLTQNSLDVKHGEYSWAASRSHHTAPSRNTFNWQTGRFLYPYPCTFGAVACSDEKIVDDMDERERQ